MMEPNQSEQFERVVMPHLGAAYNLARWLVRNPDDAEDLVQDAMLRAVRFFSGYRGGDARSWLLAIVRNSCFTWLQRHRASDLAEEFNEEAHTPVPTQISQEANALATEAAGRLRGALESIPAVFREAVVLREIEGMSYKEIANVAGVSVGTVMSRLARGRERLRSTLKVVPGARASAKEGGAL
jgi:RNA polymerase sigma-70 factor, ECF subfamily